MAETMATKSFRGFAIKDADKGEVEAVVATLGVIDRDGDIIRNGSLKGTASVTMSAWGHDAMYGAVPAGKGKLREEKNALVFSGRAFLSTTGGKETFEVLKEMGEDQEWSFGFRVTGWEAPSDEEKKAGAWRVITKMDAFEVSPVIVGAGLNTRTLAVKSAPQADGADGTPEAPALDDELKAIVADVYARREAEKKAAADLAAEAERKAKEDADAIEAKAKADADAARRAEELEAVQRIHERFVRNMRKAS